MNSIFKPSFISDSIRKDSKFRAEIIVYDILKKESENIRDNISVYYSCSFVTEKLEPGECDFILVLPNHGMAFIEVKGGGIEYDSTQNLWFTINRKKERFEIKNPAFQALKAERFFLSLIKDEKQFSNVRLNTQYFVCFADVHEPPKNISPELPNKITIFKDNMSNGFIKKIKDVLHSKRQNDTNFLDVIGPPYMEVINKIIKPSFTINPTFLTEIESEKTEMQLSDSQIAILKTLRYQKKVFIEGCAGTGKTLMAVHRAKEFIKEGKKVLILTHSRTLPIDIRYKYFNNQRFDNLRIESSFQFTANIARRKKYNSREILDKHEKSTLFSIGYPELLMHLNDHYLSEEDKYDSVIVDEGQRFSDEWWLAIDNLKKEEGYLYVFYDPNQTLKNSITSDFLTEESNHMYPLDLNFRNTKEIFNFSKELYKGFDIESAGPEGRPIEWIPVTSIVNQNKEIALRIQRLMNEGIDLDDIAIINFGPIEEKGGLQKQFRQLNVHVSLDGLESRLNKKYIRYDSVARYQGLEFPIVILTNFTRDIHLEEQNDLYIGLTRSSNHLIIITTQQKINNIKKLTNK